MPRKTKAVIHVNRQFIAMNAKDDGDRPVFTIKRAGKVTYAREVKVMGSSTLVAPGKQLSCGARAWIETYAELELTDAMTFAEAKECMT